MLDRRRYRTDGHTAGHPPHTAGTEQPALASDERPGEWLGRPRGWRVTSGQAGVPQVARITWSGCRKTGGKDCVQQVARPGSLSTGCHDFEQRVVRLKYNN